MFLDAKRGATFLYQRDGAVKHPPVSASQPVHQAALWSSLLSLLEVPTRGTAAPNYPSRAKESASYCSGSYRRTQLGHQSPQNPDATRDVSLDNELQPRRSKTAAA